MGAQIFIWTLCWFSASEYKESNDISNVQCKKWGIWNNDYSASNMVWLCPLHPFAIGSAFTRFSRRPCQLGERKWDSTFKTQWSYADQEHWHQYGNVSSFSCAYKTRWLGIIFGVVEYESINLLGSFGRVSFCRFDSYQRSIAWFARTGTRQKTSQ